MKTVALLCAVLLGALPGSARADDIDRGASLLDQGAQLLLKGLLDQVTPTLKDLGRQIGDMSDYRLPEVLPNGDIIIRRKVPLVPVPPGAPGHAIDL
ncbi:MAG: hypothetical protein GC186_16390 [Rhodobacteraceae bacterium]|nr:hypothetical protein [Paracoccaceae bacterium]